MLLVHVLLLLALLGLIVRLLIVDLVLVEDPSRPVNNNFSSLLFLSTVSTMSGILPVFLTPLVVDLLVQISTQLIVHVFVFEDPVDECFENINEVNLLYRIRVNFDIQTFQQIESVDFLDHNTLINMYQVPVFLSQALFLRFEFLWFVLLKVYFGRPFAEWRRQFVEQENQICHSNPPSSHGVEILPQINKLLDLISLNNSHILFLSRIESFNDCCN